MYFAFRADTSELLLELGARALAAGQSGVFARERGPLVGQRAAPLRALPREVVPVRLRRTQLLAEPRARLLLRHELVGELPQARVGALQSHRIVGRCRLAFKTNGFERDVISRI